MAGEDAEKDVAGEKAEETTEEVTGEQTVETPKTGGADSQESDAQDNTEVASDPVPADEVDGLIEEAVAAALVEQQDSVLRAQAEVQNMRRRCEQDVEKAHKFALEKFGGELLTVMDNLERALQSVSDTDNEQVKSLYEGVELTQKGFLDVLTRHKIEQVDPVGEPFDPQQHEAMSMIENDEVEPNTVLTVIQKGYVLNGRVIRPAMVMVAKAGSK